MTKLICKACIKEIKTKKDKYVHIKDYNKEKMVNESWWHVTCFLKAMNRDLTNLEKMALDMLNKSKQIYDKLPLEKDKEVFVI